MPNQNGSIITQRLIAEVAVRHNVFLKPDDLADSVFHVTEQRRSTWSFEVEARPFGETW